MTTLSHLQICALHYVARDHEDGRVDLNDLPHRTVQYVIWKDDEQTPVAQGSISVGGTVRPDTLVAA